MDLNLHQRYALKPSRIALGFQLFCLILIFTLLASLLDIAWYILLLLIALAALIWLRKQPQVRCFEYLDQYDWTLELDHAMPVQHVKVKQILDHSLYIVICFHEKKAKNVIIWCDQLSKNQWKSLKIRAKLH